MKKKIIYLVGIIIIAYLAYYFSYNFYQIRNLKYGVKANKLRIDLNIPIIEDDMNATSRYNDFFGNRWKINRETPNANETLHIWKNVTPSEKPNEILDNEWDAYRRLVSNSRIMQMNIESQIIGDTTSVRKGKIFYIDSPRDEKNLSEEQIDSISKLWNLDYLIKNKIN